jgi:pseudaminic acid synthase
MFKFLNKFQLHKKEIGFGCKPYLVAEISANHNGSLKTALKTIKLAKDNGADAIKLQTYTPSSMTINIKKKDFYINSGQWKGNYLYNLYEMAHTPLEWHKEIFEYTKHLGITCFSSAFDEAAVDFLEKIGTPAYKIASFEATDLELIKYASSTKKPIIISTGLATKKEIQDIINTVKKTKNDKLIILHCVSSYPANFYDYNLLTLTDIQENFKVLTGISDHTLDNTVCNSSLPLGACFFEKHFIIKRSMGGPDSSFSLEPKEFKLLKESLMNIYTCLGKPNYSLKGEEKTNIKFRRSIYAIKDIKKGDMFSKQNIKKIRPGFGLSPQYYSKILNTKAVSNIKEGQKILKKNTLILK